MRNPCVPTLAACLLALSALAGVAVAQTQPAQSPPPAQGGDSAAATSAEKPKDAPNDAAPKKVYTNDDLRHMPGDDVSVVGNSRAQKKAATGTQTKPGGHDQAYWHNRAQALQKQIAEVDRQIAQLTASAPQNISTESASGASTGSNPIYLNGQGARLNNLQSRRAALVKQMAELEDEARRAGVPPGWLR